MTAKREKAEGTASRGRLSIALSASLFFWCFRGVAGAQEWRDMSPKQRYDAMQNYWDYEKRPEPERQQMEEQYQQFQALPPADQERVRKNYERWQNLPDADRRRFERKYEKWRRQEAAPK